MKKKLALFLVATLLLGLLAGCGQGEEPTQDADTPPSESAEPSAPDGSSDETGDSSEKTNLDLNILWSAGGNGEYVNNTVATLEGKYGLNIDIEYNPKAHEVFRPLLLAGEPPDIVMVQHSFFDYFKAIEEGAFTPISEYVELPADGTDEKVIDIIGSDIVNSMRMNGDAYIILSNMNVNGLYYNKAMFDEHGWEAPTTWQEFVDLCEEIKSTTDIAPFIYPGMYPYYLQSFVMPNIASLGNGMDTIKAINNMEEGIWESDAVKGAIERLEYMRDKGYFYNGLISLSHTEAQMEFINGRVAMIAAGSWLENEMAGNWPDGFELTYMTTPAGESASDEKFVVVSGNLFGFPSEAKNKEWIGEFLQTYYSPENAKVVAEDFEVAISPAMAVENQDVRKALNSSTVSSLEAAYEHTKMFMLYNIWYPEFHVTYQNNLTALISGEINADEFCERMEAEAEKIRNDDSITKYKVD